MLAGPPTPYYPSPHLINQFCNFHPGVVKNLKDPEDRGRVMVECPGLLGSGRSNWTCWVEMGGISVGSSKDVGDEGDWWLPQVGQCVLIGFVAGYPDALWYIPGPPCSDGGKEQIPKEPKSYKDGRKSSRCRIRKSEAGHTLLMDDNGKSELFVTMSWTGCGFIAHEPGKEEDDKESPEEESKPRKGERRGTKTVWSGTAKKPSELIEGGKGYYGWNDLQGNGMLTKADDKNGGLLILKAHKSDGSVGCSFVMDPENETCYVTGGKTQVQVRGDVSRVYFTTAMIWEAPFESMSKAISSIWSKLKDRMSKYD